MSLSLTAAAVVQRALQTIGIISLGETVSAADLQQGVALIAELIDAWNTQALTVLTQERNVYDLVANQGSPSNPYTLGPGGDFDTGTAARPVAIRNAMLLLNGTTPYPTEIPLAVLTEDMYAAIPNKTITSSQPSAVFYEPTVPLGTVVLWNVPDTAENDLVLYTDLLAPAFSGSNVAYTCPPGYAKAFRLNVALVMANYYGVPLDSKRDLERDAGEALQDIKLQNAPMQDLSVDPAYVFNPHGTYVIQTDQGG